MIKDQEQYSEIQQALREGRLSEALDLLLEAAENQDQSLKEDLLLLKSRFEYNRNQYEVKGVMTDQDFNIHFSKTALGAQEILARLKRGPEPLATSTTEQKSNYQPLFWLVGILALVITGWLLWPDGSKPTNETDQLADSTTVNLPLKQDSEAGTITEPIMEPEAGAGSTNTAAKPPPVSTDLAKAVEEQPKQALAETEKPIVQEEEKAPDPVPTQTFKVNIIRNSDMSDADIYVDGQRATLLSNSLNIATVQVTEKSGMHQFELKKSGENLDCKKELLITRDNQKITFNCN